MAEKPASILVVEQDMARNHERWYGTAKSQNLVVQLAFAIANANAESASHQDAAAKTLLKQASLKATKSAYLGYQFQCRLAMEAIGLKSGKSTESRARLERFQKEATEKGFDLMARKASALLAN